MMKPELIPAVTDYFFSEPAFEDDVAKAFQKFFGVEESSKLPKEWETLMVEGWFLEWFLYEFILETGRTSIEEFISRNRFSMPSVDLVTYEHLTQGRFSLFEIVEVKTDEGIRVKDIATDKEYWVFEKSGTRGARVGNSWFIRIAKIGDHWEFVSSHPFVFPMRFGKGVGDMFRRDPLTMKDVFRLFYTRREEDDGESSLLRRWKKLDDERIDPGEAIKRFQTIIEKYDLADCVSVATIQTWMKRTRGAMDFSSLSMFTGLLEFSNVSNAEVKEAVSAFNDVYAITPQDELEGESPVERTRHRPSDESSQPIVDQIRIGMGEWSDEFEKARKRTKKGQLQRALKSYERVFELMQSGATTWRDVYRIYANIATVYFALGNEYAGKRCVDMALELNPNYDFGQTMKRQLDAGEFRGQLKRVSVVEEDAQKVFLNSTPAKYFEYLKTFNINFATKELTTSVITKHKVA